MPSPDIFFIRPSVYSCEARQVENQDFKNSRLFLELSTEIVDKCGLSRDGIPTTNEDPSGLIKYFTFIQDGDVRGTAYPSPGIDRVSYTISTLSGSFNPESFAEQMKKTLKTSHVRLTVAEFIPYVSQRARGILPFNPQNTHF